MVNIAAKRVGSKGKGCEKQATLRSLKQMVATASICEEPGSASPEELGTTRDGLKAQKIERARRACREQYESGFIIAQVATRYLKVKDVSKLPASRVLQDEIEQLMREKSTLYNGYREKKENVQGL